MNPERMLNNKFVVKYTLKVMSSKAMEKHTYYLLRKGKRSCYSGTHISCYNVTVASTYF